MLIALKGFGKGGRRGGRKRKCINANSCSCGGVTMGVGRSAEGLAPRPPPGRGRKNRKRRRISPAESHGRNPPRPSSQPPTPAHPPTRCGRSLAGSGAERGQWMRLRPGRPQVHDVFSARATPHQVQTHRQDSLRPVCHLFNFFFFFYLWSRRHATLKTRVVMHVLSSRGEKEGSQMLRD